MIQQAGRFARSVLATRRVQHSNSGQGTRFASKRLCYWLLVLVYVSHYGVTRLCGEDEKQAFSITYSVGVPEIILLHPQEDMMTETCMSPGEEKIREFPKI